MRILYVEDNMANLYLVKRVARIGKHEVINYIDGKDAVANFEKDKPDLVLMDIQLAGEMGGLDAVKLLRAKGHKVPIVAVTAYAMVGDRDRCLKAGCNDYLAKPLPIPQLADMFQHYSAELVTRKTAEMRVARSTSKDAPSTPPAPAVSKDVPSTAVVPSESKDAPSAPAAPAAPPGPAVTKDVPSMPDAPEDATLPSVPKEHLSPPTKPTSGLTGTPAQTG